MEARGQGKSPPEDAIQDQREGRGFSGEVNATAGCERGTRYGVNGGDSDADSAREGEGWGPWWLGFRHVSHRPGGVARLQLLSPWKDH